VKKKDGKKNLEPMQSLVSMRQNAKACVTMRKMRIERRNRGKKETVL